MGGLGNQMFQYAYSYLVSKEKNDADIVLDARYYKDYYWGFELDKLNIPYSKAINENIKMPYDNSVKKYHVYQRAYEIIHGHRPNRLSKKYLKKNYLFCGTFCEAPSKVKKEKDAVIYGYFQNVAILENVRSNLFDMFTAKEISKTASDYIESLTEGCTLISMRLLSEQEQKQPKKENILQDENYYKEAIKLALDKNKTTQFVFMSNDIERIKKFDWIKDIKNEKVFVEKCTPIEQMEIMKHCDNFIVSNSSFSWWGAYLGTTRSNGFVIAPRIWYRGLPLEKTGLSFKNIIKLI